MWMRNLFFVGLVGVAVVVMLGSLFPERPPRIDAYEAPQYSDPDFVAAVTAVDRTLAQQWASEGLTPAAPGPQLTIARRLALGLLGTIPSLSEIRQFEHLPEEQRLTWWLDHLLADRRFAEYFAERFARASVGTEDGPFIFYRRRRFVSWLADELAQQRPYDQIVREMIAAEGLWTSQPASNFISVTAQKDNHNQPDPVRLAGRVMRAFLGLRLDCAQCHDHPFAEWKRSDFEGLAAYFGQTRLGFTGIHNGPGEFTPLDRRTQEPHVVPPRVPFTPDLLPEQGSRRQRLAEWVTARQNPYFAAATVNRVWALLFGRPLVDPVDNLEAGPLPPVLQVLADDFAAHEFDLRRLIRVIARSRAFQLDSAADFEVTSAHEAAWAVFPLTRLRPEQVAGSILQAASVETLSSETHLVFRLIRFGQEREFLERYGDNGEDDFSGRGGTIPQRLLLMNGQLIRERLKDAPFNAATQIARYTREPSKAIEASYLALLSRRPTPEEADHFDKVLSDPTLSRVQSVADLHWALLNSTEFSWNH